MGKLKNKLIIGILVAAVVILGAVTINQYNKLERDKLTALHESYSYMLYAIEEGTENNYKNWALTSARLKELLKETDKTIEMGDYQKLREIIATVSQIEKVGNEEKAYLKSLDQINLSWNNRNWHWSVYLNMEIRRGQYLMDYTNFKQTASSFLPGMTLNEDGSCLLVINNNQKTVEGTYTVKNNILEITVSGNGKLAKKYNSTQMEVLSPSKVKSMYAYPGIKKGTTFSLYK